MPTPISKIERQLFTGRSTKGAHLCPDWLKPHWREWIEHKYKVLPSYTIDLLKKMVAEEATPYIAEEKIRGQTKRAMDPRQLDSEELEVMREMLFLLQEKRRASNPDLSDQIEASHQENQASHNEGISLLKRILEKIESPSPENKRCRLDSTIDRQRLTPSTMSLDEIFTGHMQESLATADIDVSLNSSSNLSLAMPTFGPSQSSCSSASRSSPVIPELNVPRPATVTTLPAVVAQENRRASSEQPSTDLWSCLYAQMLSNNNFHENNAFGSLENSALGPVDVTMPLQETRQTCNEAGNLAMPRLTMLPGTKNPWQ